MSLNLLSLLSQFFRIYKSKQANWTLPCPQNAFSKGVSKTQFLTILPISCALMLAAIAQLLVRSLWYQVNKLPYLIQRWQVFQYLLALIQCWMTPLHWESRIIFCAKSKWLVRDINDRINYTLENESLTSHIPRKKLQFTKMQEWGLSNRIFCPLLYAIFWLLREL